MKDKIERAGSRLRARRALPRPNTAPRALSQNRLRAQRAWLSTRATRRDSSSVLSFAYRQGCTPSQGSSKVGLSFMFETLLSA